MKLYLLQAIDPSIYDEYDVAVGFVVAATSPRVARKLAAGEAGDEGTQCWLDVNQSTVKTIARDTPASAGVVLRDFRSG